jgi:hypothetical protein
VLSRRCPIHNVSNVCSSLLINDDANRVCEVISESVESISCECSLLVHDSEGGEVVTPNDSPVMLNFGVVSRSLVHEFLDTWRSAA